MVALSGCIFVAGRHDYYHRAYDQGIFSNQPCSGISSGSVFDMVPVCRLSQSDDLPVKLISGEPAVLARAVR